MAKNYHHLNQVIRFVVNMRCSTQLPPELFCQTSFWQNDLVHLADIES